MPIYEYKCAECGFEFDAFQSMSDKALKECPECKKESLEKLISTGVVGKVPGSRTPCPKTGDFEKVEQEKADKPFWRKGEINYNILNNPERYIRTGQVDK